MRRWIVGVGLVSFLAIVDDGEAAEISAACRAAGEHARVFMRMLQDGTPLEKAMTIFKHTPSALLAAYESPMERDQKSKEARIASFGDLMTVDCIRRGF